MNRRDATILLLVLVTFSVALAGGLTEAPAATKPSRLGQAADAWLPTSSWYGDAQSALGFAHPVVACATRIALHALVALLLLRVGTAAGLDSRAAFVGAALFAVHPLAAATISTASGAGTMIATATLLGALQAHLETRRRQILERPATRSGAIAVACAAIAFAANPQTVLLPLVLLQVDRLRARALGRRLWPQQAGYVAVLALVWGPRLLGGGPQQAIDPLDNPLASLDPLNRTASALHVAAHYLAHVVAPFALSADYAFAEVRPLAPGVGRLLTTVLATLLTIAAAWRLARRRPPVGIGIGLAAATFLPAANLLAPVARAMDDRSAYLPLAGLALALAGLWSELRTRWPKLAPALASAAAAALALLAIRYTWSYRHPMAIERQVALAAPRSVRGMVWRGDDRLAFNLLDDAEATYRKAVEIAPGYAPARLGLGKVAYRKGDLAAAERHLRDALARDPRTLPAIDLTAQIAVARGDLAGAAALWRQRLEIDPDHAPTLSNLAVVEWRTGHHETALGLWRRAAQSPDAPPALLLNLAQALEATGRREEAAALRQRAVRAGEPSAR